MVFLSNSLENFSLQFLQYQNISQNAAISLLLLWTLHKKRGVANVSDDNFVYRKWVASVDSSGGRSWRGPCLQHSDISFSGLEVLCVSQMN